MIGFCDTDLGALAALHIGEWAEKPVRRHWAEIYRRFDRAVAPSRFIAERLAEAGVDDPLALPLGVDTEAFHPARGDREGLRKRLGLGPHHRLLVFAGRPAREKRVDVLVEAVERLGDPYVLLLLGAGAAAAPSDRVIELPYEKEPQAVAAILAGCDAFVHANDAEPFGLVVLEAMASGLPVVGVASGGVAEAVTALFERDVRELGRRARQRACERHGWGAVFDRLSELYADVSGDRAFTTGAIARHVA